MNFIKPLTDWISQNMMLLVIGLLVATLASNWWLSRQNDKLKTDLATSIAATNQISEKFEDYEETQGQILSGLSVLARTQEQLAIEQRMLNDTIEDAADDENRSHDPFWDSVFDGVYDDTPDDPDQ